MVKVEKEEEVVVTAREAFESRRETVRKAFQKLTDTLNGLPNSEENDDFRTGFTMLGQAEGWFNR